MAPLRGMRRGTREPRFPVGSRTASPLLPAQAPRGKSPSRASGTWTAGGGDLCPEGVAPQASDLAVAVSAEEEVETPIQRGDVCDRAGDHAAQVEVVIVGRQAQGGACCQRSVRRK